MHSNSRFSVAVIPAGGGKTFIILTLTLYILNKFNSATVYIMTTNALLKAQLDEVLGPYLRNRPNVIITEKTFPDERTKKPVFALVDESDEFCVGKAFVFNSGKVTGINNLRYCNKVIFVTATCTKFLRDTV